MNFSNNKDIPWSFKDLEFSLNEVFDKNSENELLKILKQNSFLFYELFSRKYGIQPIFHEVTFGSGLRCDFTWLNDNSDGPEWVLLEVEKPNMPLFNSKAEPSHQLNHAIEQVKSWRRYFENNPLEKRRIFGAVSRFRYVVVAGALETWEIDFAAKWRIDNNKESSIEVRSSDVFLRPLKVLAQKPSELWSFAEYPKTLAPSKLNKYWSNYEYISKWRAIF